jgi:hypothetical protein
MTTLGNLPTSLKDLITRSPPEVLDLAVTGLDLIDKAVDVDSDVEGALLATVRGVLSVIRAGADGTVKTADCAARLTSLRRRNDP